MSYLSQENIRQIKGSMQEFDKMYDLNFKELHNGSRVVIEEVPRESMASSTLIRVQEDIPEKVLKSLDSILEPYKRSMADDSELSQVDDECPEVVEDQLLKIDSAITVHTVKTLSSKTILRQTHHLLTNSTNKSKQGVT